jgi:hypothetical protein
MKSELRGRKTTALAEESKGILPERNVLNPPCRFPFFRPQNSASLPPFLASLAFFFGSLTPKTVRFGFVFGLF